MRFGVFFVDSVRALYSASVTAVMYAKSCFIEPRHNGSQLHLVNVLLALLDADIAAI